jgi:hypothetical protein
MCHLPQPSNLHCMAKTSTKVNRSTSTLGQNHRHMLRCAVWRWLAVRLLSTNLPTNVGRSYSSETMASFSRQASCIPSCPYCWIVLSLKLFCLPEHFSFGYVTIFPSLQSTGDLSLFGWRCGRRGYLQLYIHTFVIFACLFFFSSTLCSLYIYRPTTRFPSTQHSHITLSYKHVPALLFALLRS